MESMLQGGYSPVGIAANRRMRSCSRCGKQGHNRVTCGRAAARFRLPTRLCTKCGQRGHYEILCLNPATSIVMVDQVNHTEDDGAVVGADTPVKPCKWHEMKKGLEKSVP